MISFSGLTALKQGLFAALVCGCVWMLVFSELLAFLDCFKAPILKPLGTKNAKNRSPENWTFFSLKTDTRVTRAWTLRSLKTRDLQLQNWKPSAMDRTRTECLAARWRIYFSSIKVEVAPCVWDQKLIELVSFRILFWSPGANVCYDRFPLIFIGFPFVFPAFYLESHSHVLSKVYPLGLQWDSKYKYSAL